MSDLSTEFRTNIQDTQKRYPFLTFLSLCDGSLCVGIVQNETPKLIWFYDFDLITFELKKEFLKLGDQWWYESNQSIPINYFIGLQFDQFQNYLNGYPKKSIKKIIGPTFCLANQYLKRIKKKRIEIINSRV